MENIMSGSVSIEKLSDEDIEESLDMLMRDEQFEQDLINSFNDKMYFVKNTAPNPIWAFCSLTMKLIRVIPSTELLPVDSYSFEYEKDSQLIECLSGQNLIKIPKKYIETGEWH